IHQPGHSAPFRRREDRVRLPDADGRGQGARRNLYIRARIQPPSTAIDCAVMYDARSDARKAASAANSSGSPRRFIGTSFSKRLSTEAVSMLSRLAVAAASDSTRSV